MKRAAAEAMAGAATDEQKVRQIFDYCRTKIRNTESRDGDVSPDEIRDMKGNANPSSTLKQGIGTGRDIDMLFAAMLTAAGMDARIACVADASNAPVGPLPPNAVFLPAVDVAVNVGGKWQFYDPGTPNLPFGMLRWQEEGMPALLTDSKQPEFVASSLTPVARNLQKRTAALTLGVDGSITGTVHEEWSGQAAYQERRLLDGKKASDCEKLLTESIHEYASAAEVVSLKIENQNDLDKPLAVSFALTIPGYATRTGKRILFQPALFHANRNARFASSTRANPVFFPYGWTEEDEISIAMPPGFALEHPDVPPPLKVGKTIQYEAKASILNGKTFVYHRLFRVGEGGNMVVPTSAYASVKRIFDSVQEGDNHSITLKVEDKVASK